MGNSRTVKIPVSITSSNLAFLTENSKTISKFLNDIIEFYINQRSCSQDDKYKSKKSTQTGEGSSITPK
jgi:hypothetical protein